MALFENRPASSLTLTDGLMTGFRIVIRPMFIVPILVIGAIVNAIVVLAILPAILGAVGVSSSTEDALTGAMIGSIVASVVAALVLALIGGILVNLYGQIWAVEASKGGEPTWQQVLNLIGSRWIGVVGVGLVFAVIGIVALVVFGVVGALLGGVGVLLDLVGVVALVWFSARLSMAGWLAAAGGTIEGSLRSSWTMTEGQLLRIVGWTIVFAIVFGIVGSIIGAILGIVPVIGAAVASAIQSGFGYGSGVTLFRKVEAAASAGPAQPMVSA